MSVFREFKTLDELEKSIAEQRERSRARKEEASANADDVKKTKKK